METTSFVRLPGLRSEVCRLCHVDNLCEIRIGILVIQRSCAEMVEVHEAQDRRRAERPPDSSSTSRRSVSSNVSPGSQRPPGTMYGRSVGSRSTSVEAPRKISPRTDVTSGTGDCPG